jgi:hypothetical protein
VRDLGVRSDHLFDRLANRWFMLEMGGTSSANRLCTYVSKTSDPVSGGWWFYGFATPALPDYPHCGVWNDAYVCGDNESGTGAKVYAFDRANMLNGATARPAQRFTSVAKLSGYGFQMMTPASFYGTTAAPAGRKQSSPATTTTKPMRAPAPTPRYRLHRFVRAQHRLEHAREQQHHHPAAHRHHRVQQLVPQLLDSFATVPQPGSTSRSTRSAKSC